TATSSARPSSPSSARSTDPTTTIRPKDSRRRMSTTTLEAPASRFADYVPADRTRCRFCGTPLEHTFVDLGMSPLCESYLSQEQLNEMEAFYPLHVYVCGRCYLVQLQEYVSGEEIFREYAYFSRSEER